MCKYVLTMTVRSEGEWRSVWEKGN